MILSSLTRAVTGVRASCFSLALLVCAPLVHADTPIAGDDSDATALDSRIQELKKQALDFNRDALSAEEDYLYPIYTRLSVGVSVSVSGLLLHRLTLRVDDDEPYNVIFDNSESIALLKSKGIYPVTRVNTPAGTHKISAQFEASYADSKPNDPPLTGSIEQSFVKDDRTRSVELVIGHGAPFSRPELALKTWSAPQ